MFPGKQPPEFLAAVLMGLIVLSLAILIGLGLTVGWLSMPLAKLPPMYWLLYVPLVTSSALFLVIVTLIPKITSSYTNVLTVLGNAIAALFGAMVTVNALLTPTWTGGRLFDLTVGAFLLIQGTGGLLRFWLAKKEHAA